MSVAYFTPTKKSFLWESLVALPLFFFTATWLVLIVIHRGPLFHNLDYFTTALLNLLLPLAIIGIGRLVYGCLVVADALRHRPQSTLATVLIAVLLWLLSQHLGTILYLIRAILLFSKKS